MKAFISSRITQPWLEKLEDLFEIDRSNTFEKGNLSPQELLGHMRGCQIAVIENEEVSAEVLNQCPDLVAVVDFRGTAANIDVQAATDNGVIIFNTPGRNADAVADLTAAFVILNARKVMQGVRAIQDGLWTSKGTRWAYITHQGFDMAGKVVGLVGLGHIGRLVAKRLAAFDMRLIGYDPFVTPEDAQKFGVEWMSLDNVLKNADFVSLHLPSNPHTRGMIAENELRLMKPSAYLINTSRADVIDEAALIRCLTENWIAGAALDVFYHEPIDADYPLVNLPNVICTPHIGGATSDVVENQSRIGINALLEFLNGSCPANTVNPAAFEKASQKLKRYAD